MEKMKKNVSLFNEVSASVADIRAFRMMRAAPFHHNFL